MEGKKCKGDFSLPYLVFAVGKKEKYTLDQSSAIDEIGRGQGSWGLSRGEIRQRAKRLFLKFLNAVIRLFRVAMGKFSYCISDLAGKHWGICGKETGIKSPPGHTRERGIAIASTIEGKVAKKPP